MPVNSSRLAAVLHESLAEHLDRKETQESRLIRVAGMSDDLHGPNFVCMSSSQAESWEYKPSLAMANEIQCVTGGNRAVC